MERRLRVAEGVSEKSTRTKLISERKTKTSKHSRVGIINDQWKLNILRSK